MQKLFMDKFSRKIIERNMPEGIKAEYNSNTEILIQIERNKSLIGYGKFLSLLISKCGKIIATNMDDYFDGKTIAENIISYFVYGENNTDFFITYNGKPGKNNHKAEYPW